jgi:hypothetical protein
MVYLSLDRYSPRRCRGQSRNAFHQYIICVVFRHYEHGVVRVLHFHLDCACSKLGQPTLWHFHRFASGTLGPVTYGLGLRDSGLVTLFFNLLCRSAGIPVRVPRREKKRWRGV